MVLELGFRDNLHRRINKYAKKKWFRFLAELFCRIKENEVTAIGAQLTYYLILSIFPFLIFFLNILSYTSIAQEDVLDNLLIVLPMETQIMIKDIVKETILASSDTLLSLGIVLSIWTGSLGITAIIRAINKAYNVKKKRPYWRLKGLAILFTIALVILLIIVLSMLVFGEIIGQKLFGSLRIAYIFYHMWELLRIIIPLLSMVVIFALLYKFSITPEEGLNIKFNQTLPGAVFATVGWILASMIFSFYVNNFGKYSRTYGSLGGVIILLIWIYISSIMIVLGGEINGAYASLIAETGVDDCDEDKEK